MIYFTSDLHFYHDKIIGLTSRPFQNAEKMNACLIRNWNEVVQDEDEVYVLGDFTLKGGVLANTILEQLNGTKYLIKGNHDAFVSSRHFYQEHFQWIKNYAEFEYQSRFFVLCHYPLLEWNRYYRGAYHVHGHQHNRSDYNENNRQNHRRAYDVGVDANQFKPVSIEAIITFFESGEI